jgi:20S proteasome alpha/beta subunit
MTVLVSVKINDGVVMAADSATSFASGMIYHHVQKIMNLRKGLPIGAMGGWSGGISFRRSATRQTERVRVEAPPSWDQVASMLGSRRSDSLFTTS